MAQEIAILAAQGVVASVGFVMLYLLVEEYEKEKKSKRGTKEEWKQEAL